MNLVPRDLVVPRTAGHEDGLHSLKRFGRRLPALEAFPIGGVSGSEIGLVLVRDVGLPGWLRVTAGLPSENNAFLAAIREIW